MNYCQMIRTGLKLREDDMHSTLITCLPDPTLTRTITDLQVKAEGRNNFKVNYDYKGKYLVELNARYDASSKFPPETRWGFFPSASVAWRLSEESFIKDNLPFITNLKLRASRGKLGYDATGSYQYLSTYSITSSYIFDEPRTYCRMGSKQMPFPILK